MTWNTLNHACDTTQTPETKNNKLLFSTSVLGFDLSVILHSDPESLPNAAIMKLSSTWGYIP